MNQPPRRVVLATGVFDLLHAQHVLLLQLARSLGQILLVGINSDASVRRLKGQARPIVCQQDREAMLKALRCVHEVMIFEEDTPLELIKHVRPDILVKGHDYSMGQKPIPESAVLKAWGGRVVIAPTSGRTSTSQLINRILETHK